MDCTAPPRAHTAPGGATFGPVHFNGRGSRLSLKRIEEDDVGLF
jgi:hypothetical protein